MKIIRANEIDIKDIKKLEAALNIKVPEELTALWLKYGCGFFDGREENINRFMDIDSILDFRNKTGDYEHLPDIEIYDDFSEGKFVFFEANESAYISIGFTADNYGKVFYYDAEIASSIADFLEKMDKDDLYYTDLL